ncbi:hypothetical protein D030_5315A, partial [Vibrio parahaemolyticus AQ3810]
MSYQEFQHY